MLVVSSKTITFNKLKTQHVTEYRIFIKYTEGSELKTKLIDVIPNDSLINAKLYQMELTYNFEQTWKLPVDAMLNREYPFYLEVNGEKLSLSTYGTYNRVNRDFSIIKSLREIPEDASISLCYYKNVITKTYSEMEQECSFIIEPVLKDSAAYGTHNIIL